MFLFYTIFYKETKFRLAIILSFIVLNSRPIFFNLKKRVAQV